MITALNFTDVCLDKHIIAHAEGQWSEQTL